MYEPISEIKPAENRHAVITGATQGIGRAIAEKLLEEGFSVSVCARNLADLQSLEQEWTASYPKARILVAAADFSEKNEVLRFAASVRATGLPVDILVNNAGIYEPGHLATEPEGQIERLMAVNFFSAYHLTRALLPAMQETGRGNIFNLCSVASLKAYPNGGAYSITKYALLGFSENLRQELRPVGIKVTAICPGGTWSRSWSSAGIIRDRFMEASDVAEMVWGAYKLSPKAVVETIVMRPQAGDL